ncbi:MAG: hypothetical protein EZS28_049226, partial [Streblomastix strix]
MFVLAGCHSLSTVGDPLERAAFEATGCKQQHTITILHRFIFDPQLARSSTIVKISVGSERNDSGQSGMYYMALCKGSPEAILPLLAKHGSRVIALSYKKMHSGTLSELVSQPRKSVEKDLIFAGFLVLSCPLRSEAKRTVRRLQ